MLNQRQTEILLELYENSAGFFTAAYFSKKKNTSLRTVQSDIKFIKEELKEKKCATIESMKAKGSYLKIIDPEVFSDFINNLYFQYTCGTLNYPLNRVNQIIFILLSRFRDMSIYTLADELHVSHSTLTNDLKGVQENLEKFHLTILRENNRLSIRGSEINKRRCLAENNLYLAHVQVENDADNYISMQRISYIKNILLDIFMENQYYIADTDFNNAILNINIMLHRAQKGFYIKKEEVEITDDLEKERIISAKIFKRLEMRFLCSIPEAEVRFFAIYLKGQEICKNHEIISEEMDLFIADSFVKIKKNYGIDFTNNINLRIAMALHCIPLVIRIRYNMQIQDPGLKDIKQSFPLGYEIASYFAFLVKEKYGKKIMEDEISLIAVHFYSSLLDIKKKQQRTKVLIISSLKMSMTVLLRQIFIKWFSEEVSDLEFIQAGLVSEEVLDEYDVYLTTEKNDFYEKGVAMYINLFPTENDRKNIKLLLDGFSNLDDVIQIFQEDLFFHCEEGNKQDILKKLTLAAEEKYNLSSFYDAVTEREKIGSTFFSKGIAIPHPIQAISSDTFVATCVVSEAVIWDEELNKVQVIMLVHIGKNNPRSFQIWDYFSSIFADKAWLEKIVSQTTYENFIKNIKELLSSKFTKEK